MNPVLHTAGDSTDVRVAAERLYDAEIALHIAHQTGVDAWVRAAADRLHEAVVAHRALTDAGLARPPR
jgi:hypothetical protein